MADELQKEIGGMTEGDKTTPEASLHSIQTYQSDMAEAVKEKQGSVIKIAVAEQEKKTKEFKNASPKSGKNILLISIGGLFLLSGIGALGYGIYKRSQNTVPLTPQKTEIVSLIPSNTEKTINITGMTKEQLLTVLSNEFTNSTLASGVETISLTEKIGEANTPVTAPALFEKTGSTIPGALVRSIDPKMMLGVYATNGNNPFIILKVDSYTHGFANMLVWESTLLSDIGRLFGIDTTGENNYLLNAKWKDKVLKNQDTRAIIDASGKIILYYSFIGTDKNLIVIATKDTTLLEITNRLTSNTIKN